MFICTPCLKAHYTNDTTIMSSLGKCESCGNQAVCNDIHHSQLVHKDIKPEEPIAEEENPVPLHFENAGELLDQFGDELQQNDGNDLDELIPEGDGRDRLMQLIEDYKNQKEDKLWQKK